MSSNSVLIFGDDYSGRVRRDWRIKELISDIVNEGMNKRRYVILASRNSFGPYHLSHREEPIYDFNKIENIIGCLNGFDNVITWHNREEPNDGYYYNYQEIADVYSNFKRIDSNRPVWMHLSPAHRTDNLNQWKEDTWLYSNAAADIISGGIAPESCGPENEEEHYPYCVFENNELSVVGDMVDNLINITEGRKPVWMVIGSQIPIRGDMRTFYISQRAFMTYQAIIHGATGIFYYGLGYTEHMNQITRPLVNDMFLMVGNNILSFSEVISSHTVRKEINIQDGIEYIIKNVCSALNNECYYILIAVNKNNYYNPNPLRYYINTNYTHKEFIIDTDFEGRIYPDIEFGNSYYGEDIYSPEEIESYAILRNKVLSVDFPSFGVRVYKIPIIHNQENEPIRRRLETG